VSVRGTEKVCLYQFVGFVRILQVILAQIFKASYVVISVVPEAMSPFYNHFKLFGMLSHIVTYQEEGRFDVVFVQQVQYPRSDAWYGAVVESQVDSLYILIHAPIGTWVKPADDTWRLLYEHDS